MASSIQAHARGLKARKRFRLMRNAASAIAPITKSKTPRQLEPEIPASNQDDIWPLQIVDLGDEELMNVLYDLLGGLPQVILHYLHNSVFPETMEFRESKLSASGQDVGGSILFPLRLGFSGTPSNLLPEELGKCRFALHDEAKILTTLTNPAIVSLRSLPDNWSVDSALDLIAQVCFAAVSRINGICGHS